MAKHTTSKIIYLVTLTCLALVAGFFGGYLFYENQSRHLTDWNLLIEVYELLETYGLQPLPPEPAAEYGMIRGLVQAYNDPYTSFVEPVQHELDTNNLSGKFGGIGVRLGRDQANMIVLYPLPDSPAAAAGVMENDRLVSIDHILVTEVMTIAEIQAALRGPVGKWVTISLLRPPRNEPLEYRIKRAEIPVPSVTWHLDGDEQTMGIIQVNLIAARTGDEIKNAVEDLDKRGATAFVLDLRDNYGGLLSAGVDIARLFLTEGVILEQQYRDKAVERFSVEKPGVLAEIPLVVLINHNTASAAEIVAGALQLNDRAELIGNETFGKDTIQLVYDLRDGSSLHVTAARWWIPGLEPGVGNGGLQPDILISSNQESTGPDLYIQQAIKLFFDTP